jgi:hypothetical protein
MNDWDESKWFKVWLTLARENCRESDGRQSEVADRSASRMHLLTGVTSSTPMPSTEMEVTE